VSSLPGTKRIAPLVGILGASSRVSSTGLMPRLGSGKIVVNNRADADVVIHVAIVRTVIGDRGRRGSGRRGSRGRRRSPNGRRSRSGGGDGGDSDSSDSDSDSSSSDSSSSQSSGDDSSSHDSEQEETKGSDEDRPSPRRSKKSSKRSTRKSRSRSGVVIHRARDPILPSSSSASSALRKVVLRTARLALQCGGWGCHADGKGPAYPTRPDDVVVPNKGGSQPAPKGGRTSSPDTVKQATAKVGTFAAPVLPPPVSVSPPEQQPTLPPTVYPKTAITPVPPVKATIPFVDIFVGLGSASRYLKEWFQAVMLHRRR
jgi:hypothetical protein